MWGLVKAIIIKTAHYLFQRPYKNIQFK